MKVLLIVDMQNDFCPGGTLPVTEGHAIVPTINALMSSGEFDVVIATKDWHPTNHVSFADNHPGANVFAVIETLKGNQILWPRHCVQGTPGAEFHPDLDQSRIQHVVTKGLDSDVDSYSGFFDNAREHETPLRALIERLAQERGESLENVEVCVCGLALDYCVAATARDAVSLGLKTTIILDASRAVDCAPGRDVERMRGLIANGIALQTSAEILPDASREYGTTRERSVERGMAC